MTKNEQGVHSRQGMTGSFFRLLPLVNFFMFTFAALALYGNRDTQSEFDRFVILAVASFIVLLYELLACVEPIKKYRGPKIP